MNAMRLGSPAYRRRNSASSSCRALQAKHSADFPPSGPAAGGLGLVGLDGASVFPAGVLEIRFDLPDDGFSSVAGGGGMGIGSVGTGDEGRASGGGGRVKPGEDSLSAWGFEGGKEIGEEFPSCGGDFLSVFGRRGMSGHGSGVDQHVGGFLRLIHTAEVADGLRGGLRGGHLLRGLFLCRHFGQLLVRAQEIHRQPFRPD